MAIDQKTTLAIASRVSQTVWRTVMADDPATVLTPSLQTVRPPRWATVLPPCEAQDDHITEVDWLIAEADDDLRAGAAVQLGTASAVEVWHQARRIVRVPANKQAPLRPDG